MDSDRWQLIGKYSRDVLILSRPGGIEFISEQVVPLTGWQPETLLGSPFLELVHPDDRAQFIERRATMEAGEPVAMRCRIRHADGSHHWWDARAAGVPDDDGVHRGLALSSWRLVDDDMAVLDALRTRERWLELVAENSTDVIVVAKPDGTLAWTSRPIVMWDTVEPERYVGRAPWDFFHPDDIPTAMATLARLLEEGSLTEPVVLRMGTPESDWRWVAVTGHVIDEGVVVSFRVVHDEVLANLALADSERRYRDLAENAADVVYTITEAGQVTWISPSVAEVLGWRPDDVVGRHIGDFLHPDDLQRHRAERDAVISAGGRGAQVVTRFRAADGSWRWVGLTGRVLRDPEGRAVGGIESLRDISAEMDARHALAHAATHDPLTGLANRSSLVEEIRRSIVSGQRSGRPTAVVLLDLDHFKFVNDSLGHATGDELLREAGRRITAAVRESDLVARHGGDEFVVVMRELDDPAEAVRVAQRLVESFRVPVVVDRNELFVSASVGVSVSREGSDVESLLAEADAAMYVAKEDGRDRLSLFNDELRAAVTDRLQTELALRHALDRDELEVWFQPEVDLLDGRMTAVEALLRWRRHDGRTMTADAFVGVAEESGLIVEIGSRVIRRSFAAAARWNRESGEPLRVRVNLSTRQLAEADLLATIDDALDASGASPADLCFEITETALLRDIPAVHANLRGIHERGFSLAVDDFGTGYASLTYLRRLPVDVLKLDRSFVRGIAEEEADRQLVAGVIGLARNLGITVTAEGVESPEQAAVLLGLGCRRAQGFLYSPAVPAATVDELVGAMGAGRHPTTATRWA